MATKKKKAKKRDDGTAAAVELVSAARELVDEYYNYAQYASLSQQMRRLEKALKPFDSAIDK